MEKEKHREKMPEKKVEETFIEKVIEDLQNLKTDEEKLKFLDDKIVHNAEHIEKHNAELRNLSKGLGAAKQEQDTELALLRNKVYDSDAADMLNRIQTIAFPAKMKQLINSIANLRTNLLAFELDKKELLALHGKVDEIIKNKEKDEQAKKVADILTTFETEYLKIEDLFLKLKNLALSISIDDPHFADRIAGKYSGYLIQVMSALFNQGSLPSLSIPFLIENISNYSDSPLADGDRNIRRTENKHVFETNRPEGKIWTGPLPAGDEGEE